MVLQQHLLATDMKIGLLHLRHGLHWIGFTFFRVDRWIEHFFVFAFSLFLSLSLVSYGMGFVFRWTLKLIVWLSLIMNYRSVQINLLTEILLTSFLWNNIYRWRFIIISVIMSFKWVTRTKKAEIYSKHIPENNDIPIVKRK